MKTEKYYCEPSKQIPQIETDVFIAGAGTSGCIAAIAAARTGAKVVLVEKLPVPGGTYTNGGIGTYSFYAAETNPERAKRIVGGIAFELAQRLEAAGGATGFVPTANDHYHSPYRFMADHEIYKGVISEMLIEAGVTVFLQTMFCGVAMEEERIMAAFIENKDGRRAVIAKQYIDASGDGDIAKHAGLEQVENWQNYDQVCGGPTGLVFGMNGIDFDRVIAENPEAAFPLGTTIPARDGKLPIQRFAFAHTAVPGKYKKVEELDINFFTSFQSIHPNEATYINNSKGVMTDASKAENLSHAEMQMRIKIMKMARVFKESVPGFENSYISWASIQLGIRASKITICDRILTQQEILEATRFEDEIGLYGFHDLSPRRPECLVREPGFYGMPYKMLLPKKCSNLYMAGRCVTVDIEAHMSTRNTVSCMIMGQAAGVAAAMCSIKGCDTRELDYSELRKTLLEQDVILEA
ncbi:MAG: putative rane protein [Herbinix sp.]|nr:putative rane protein [Herbinix sp.]